MIEIKPGSSLFFTEKRGKIMGHKAICNVIENGKNNYFYAHWGANSFSPVLKIYQSLEIQKDKKELSLAHNTEQIDNDNDMEER